MHLEIRPPAPISQLPIPKSSNPAVTHSDLCTMSATDSSEPAYWEKIWQELQPGQHFDKLEPAPALVTFLSTTKLLPRKGLTALIPGCGRAYDAHLLATSSNFSHVTGLDVSRTAINRAGSYLTDVNTPMNKYTLVEGNFFDDNVASGPFDFVYDYTFFCALPPAKRTMWATGMARRLVNGGLLATLMFPLGKPPKDGGPPFGVSFDEYERVLADVGFACVDGPRALADDECNDGRTGGKCAWAVWRKEGGAIFRPSASEID